MQLPTGDRAQARNRWWRECKNVGLWNFEQLREHAHNNCARVLSDWIALIPWFQNDNDEASVGCGNRREKVVAVNLNDIHHRRIALHKLQHFGADSFRSFQTGTGWQRHAHKVVTLILVGNERGWRALQQIDHTQRSNDKRGGNDVPVV